jgi:beta-1,2-mannobiose phosphorylase / 1,2-beta-oligomannan phosphorylase
MNKPKIHCSPKPVLTPRDECDWADIMVANPAIIEDPDIDMLHMLFRATGTWKEKECFGTTVSYPICLGYAKSFDNGETWEADFERPAIEPALKFDVENLYQRGEDGLCQINYANGCIEDPRIFQMDGEFYLTAACRMFPPGAYWRGVRLEDILPGWAREENNPFGLLASQNQTTTILYKINFIKLREQNYEEAFQYIGPLTDGNITDNRDVFFFPEKMMIDGKLQYVMLHRPEKPYLIQEGCPSYKPAIFMAAAENIKDFAEGKVTHHFFAKGIFDWEEERVGASFPPIKIGNGEWLLSYHGKQLPEFGYTQSFMIVKEMENDFPVITNRCSKRLLYAKQPWELSEKFQFPCIFITGGIVKDDELIMSYGAADQNIGMAWAYFDEVVDYVRTFDENGYSLE